MLWICVSIAGTMPLFGLSPADAPETEKLFLPAWPETGVIESGGIFHTFSDAEILSAAGYAGRDQFS